MQFALKLFQKLQLYFQMVQMKAGDAFHGTIVYSEQHGTGWDVADFLKCYVKCMPVHNQK